MSTRTTMLLIAVLTFVGAPASAFEGALHMTTTIAQMPPFPSVVNMRENGDSRTDSVVPGANEPMSIIQKLVGKNATTVTLMHSKRTYTETSVPADQPPPPGAAQQLKDLQVKALGEESVAGYSCKHALLTQKEGMTVEVWVTKALGIDTARLRRAEGMGGEMIRLLEKHDMAGFPMRMRVSHRGQTMTVETTKVETKKLDPAMFELPKGYTKTTAP